MGKQSGLEYRAQIAKLAESDDFEKEGDALFLHHEDSAARLLWAFHRPGGSHPSQVADIDPVVSAMGFSHSKLGALERFRLLNPEVLESSELRQKISKRARMLFRSLADDDFSEMAVTVREFPVYAELSVDQLINGRKMIEDIRLHLPSVNEYLYLVQEHWSEGATAALSSRMRPIGGYDEENIAIILREIKGLDVVHETLKNILLLAIEEATKTASHPLKKIALQKEREKLGGGL